MDPPISRPGSALSDQGNGCIEINASLQNSPSEGSYGILISGTLQEEPDTQVQLVPAGEQHPADGGYPERSTGRGKDSSAQQTTVTSVRRSAVQDQQNATKDPRFMNAAQETAKVQSS
ncbi:hypothetical protein AK812_SmicGene18394 [Symbiodinium microadriaticum]|uniref:Uncharacterized protein n=1 Tax=Symbiodinium microadriaticum TaxID=2951 RepID=A0A1Q9DVD2_SYMMI|nr:hypothetical protein AK812_SmicGene18394 [Symbiodinium microadriaticum]